ncbi:MAG: sigma-70 family RNA polymerase sigma factor [Oscillospiraceae bacterium]|nr:sigma-70 family RNA polymerase sigma factor [Oscillospiraceae bacterium]MBQ4537991.1 sigma-70 family RNA polymerase sigma factor [Oscillospiraceae bacterium]
MAAYENGRQRDEIIESNMGLVHSCAHRFKGRGIEYEDLFQAGCIGLIKAADAFDMSRGVRFSTYAVPVILGEMRRLFRDGGAIKVSRSLKELSMKIARVREQLAVNGSEPTVSQLAQQLEVSEEEIIEAIGVCAPPVSLTESEEAGGGQLDLPVESPEEHTGDLIALRQTLELLDERDRSIILLRYFGEKTQSQTAERLGMTQVQVSRREKKIMTRLRQELLGVS